MKKIALALFLAVFLCLSFVAAGSEDGWNYKAHLRNTVIDSVHIVWKWNDAYLSSDGETTCIPNCQGTSAWYMVHSTGKSGDCAWHYFAKYVAPPSDAYLSEGMWYEADGSVIGPNYGFGMARIVTRQHSCTGGFYLDVDSPSGFGYYKEK